MAEILHFEILRKHGQTHRQTDMGITIPRPPPMGGEVIIQTQMNTDKHTDRQTDMGITIPRPPPMGGEVIIQTQMIFLVQTLMHNYL